MEEKQLKRNLILFPVGTIGRDAIYYLFTNCIMTFVLFTRTLTNAQFGAITAIVVAARIFDGLNDPIMGNIIEQTRTRWGKFKPWLVIGIISTSVVVYLAFNTNLQGWSFVWFFGIIYFLYSITYTMHDISYWGLIPALSSDANRRNQFTSRATLCAGIGGTLASVLIPMYTIGSSAIGGNTASAYGTIALITCILAPLFLSFTIFGVREHRDDKPAEVKAFNFKEVIQTLTKNDQVKWIALIFLIQQIGNGLIIGGLGATYIYFDYGYEGGLFSTFSIIGMFPTALLMIFYPAISRKIHRKDLMKIMAGIAMVGYGLMLIAAFFLPSTMMKFWVVLRPVLLLSHHDDLHHQYGGIQRVQVRQEGRGHHLFVASLPYQNGIGAHRSADEPVLHHLRCHEIHQSDLGSGKSGRPESDHGIGQAFRHQRCGA